MTATTNKAIQQARPCVPWSQRREATVNHVEPDSPQGDENAVTRFDVALFGLATIAFGASFVETTQSYVVQGLALVGILGLVAVESTTGWRR